MKQYLVLRAGGDEVGVIEATCVSEACQKLIATLERPATLADFVVREAG